VHSREHQCLLLGVSDTQIGGFTLTNLSVSPEPHQTAVRLQEQQSAVWLDEQHMGDLFLVVLIHVLALPQQMDDWLVAESADASRMQTTISR
jgi:hypothetical protein